MCFPLHRSSWRLRGLPELVPVESGAPFGEVQLARLAGERVAQVADLAGSVGAHLDEGEEVAVRGVQAGEDLVASDGDRGRAFDAPLHLDEQQVAVGVDGADVEARVR